MRPMHHHTKLATTSDGFFGSAVHAVGGVYSALHSLRMQDLVVLIGSLLVVPVLLLLDIVLFQFTRPTCAGCASLGEFLTQHSTTLAFIQTNRSIADVLQLLKKSV